MQGINAVPSMSANWFELKGPYAFLKKEHEADFAAYAAQMKEKEQTAEKNFLSTAAQRDQAAVLTEEQAAALAEKYDINNLTREEYRALVGDLCELGMLDEADKCYVGATNLGLVPMNFSSQAELTTAPYPTGTSILEHVRYYGTMERYDPFTHQVGKGRSAILYERIAKLMDQILLQRG